MSAARQVTPTPRQREIVAVARELLETGGGLSMRRLADRLGIQAPSLYAHFDGKASLEAMLIAEGLAEWTAFADAATADAADPLTSLAHAYRDYATAHPHMYRLMTEQPLHRELLPAGSEDRAAAPLTDALGGDEDLSRAFWSFLHGMTINELNARFPPGADLEEAYRSGIEAFRAAT